MLSLLPILSLVQHPSCLLSKKGELWAPFALSSGLGTPGLLVGLLALGCQGPGLRKCWPEVLALGWKPWRRKIGWSGCPCYQFLPRPRHVRSLVDRGHGLAKVLLTFQPLVPLRTVPLPSRYTMQNFPDLRTQLPCPLVLPECLQLLLS